MLIDAHCHFFTNSLLAERLQKDTKSLINLTKRFQSPTSSSAIQGAANFLSTAVNNTPLDMYNYMKESYGCDFIAVPLMMDLTYAFMSPEQNKKTDSALQKAFDTLKSSNLSLESIKTFEKKFDTFERSVLGIDIFKNSYVQQIEDLTGIKEQIPDRVYPFFSVDPRRDNEFDGGILSEIKKYVGRDKPFLGVKLYSSLGYSPTNPILYDNGEKESVYGYCEKNKIPITIHSSIEGFSHFLDQTYIDGDVYYPDAGKCVPAETVYKDGIVKYKMNVPKLNYTDITSERLLLLNHPIIWKKVLEKYPRLKLNMAHFGGVVQMYKYANNDLSAYWPEYVSELLNEFPNVYSDFSCYYEQGNNPDFMKVIYKNVYQKLSRKAKNKVMFGSDFYMLALYNTEPKEYIKHFREAFGKNFYKFSEENPRLFLSI